MKLFFVRHGEHSVEASSLTSASMEEMQAVRDTLDFNDTTVFFYPPGVRFEESAQIIMGEMDSVYKRREMRTLSYNKINLQTPYYQGLIESIRQNRCLEYHFIHSDNHIRETGEYISSYTTMASFVSELLLKYIEIQNRVSNNKETDIHRIFCAREFLWATFRAKIVELKHGGEYASEYVEWYSRTQEGKPEARKSVASILWQDPDNGSSIRLSDVYGEEEITLEDLHELIRQEQELLEGSPMNVS